MRHFVIECIFASYSFTQIDNIMTLAIQTNSQRSAILTTVSDQINKVFPLPLQVVKRKRRSDYSTIRKICVFARQLMKHDADLSLSDAMTYASSEIKLFPHKYMILKFKNVSGKIEQRIILNAGWSELNKVKGTGRPLKENQRLFIDAVKMHTGKPSTISTYVQNIIEKF